MECPELARAGWELGAGGGVGRGLDRKELCLSLHGHGDTLYQS